MSNGYGYHTRLSEEQCVRRLDNILEVIKEDYNFLWEGNPSLISKYGEHEVYNFKVDSGRQIYLESDLAGSWKGFGSLGIVKELNQFVFYLNARGSSKKKSLITNSHIVYTNLKKQFDLSTKACFDGWAVNVQQEIRHILEKDLENRIYLLGKKLLK